MRQDFFFPRETALAASKLVSCSPKQTEGSFIGLSFPPLQSLPLPPPDSARTEGRTLTS